MRKDELETILRMLEGEDVSDSDVDSAIEEIADEVREEVNKKMQSHIHISDGTFQVLPLLKEDQIDRIMICGASGSGKSTWIGQYTEQYHKLFPENKVLLFSRKKEDKELDKLGFVKRVRIDDDFLKLQYEPKDFKNTLTIFDDIDTFQNKQITLAIQSLRDDLLETGRSENSYVIGVSHHIFNHKSTKTLLNETNKFVYFPASGGEYQVDRLMRNFFGFSTPQMKIVKSINSHWICLNRSFPTTIIGERDIYITDFGLKK